MHVAPTYGYLTAWVSPSSKTVLPLAGQSGRESLSHGGADLTRTMAYDEATNNARMAAIFIYY